MLLLTIDRVTQATAAVLLLVLLRCCSSRSHAAASVCTRGVIRAVHRQHTAAHSTHVLKILSRRREEARLIVPRKISSCTLSSFFRIGVFVWEDRDWGDGSRGTAAGERVHLPLPNRAVLRQIPHDEATAGGVEVVRWQPVAVVAMGERGGHPLMLLLGSTTTTTTTTITTIITLWNTRGGGNGHRAEVGRG